MNRITICNRPYATRRNSTPCARETTGRRARIVGAATAGPPAARAEPQHEQHAQPQRSRAERVPCLVRIDLAAERLPVEQRRASAHHGARLELPPPCCVPSRTRSAEGRAVRAAPARASARARACVRASALHASESASDCASADGGSITACAAERRGCGQYGRHMRWRYANKVIRPDTHKAADSPARRLAPSPTAGAPGGKGKGKYGDAVRSLPRLHTQTKSRRGAAPYAHGSASRRPRPSPSGAEGSDASWAKRRV